MSKNNASRTQGATIFSQSQFKTARLGVSPNLFDFFDAVQPDDTPPKDAHSLNSLFKWLDKLPFEQQFFEVVRSARRHNLDLRHFRTAFEFWRQECRDDSQSSCITGEA